MWNLAELVEEAETRIAALPPPKNGQVRAVPDERTVRYYAAIGLLDRPAQMRGRTALYDSRHLAQIVAIKRLQGAGKSLGEIRELWPTLDDVTLGRMSGVRVERRIARREFWKADDAAAGDRDSTKTTGNRKQETGNRQYGEAPPPALELRVELAPGVALALSCDAPIPYLSPADLHALRAAAAPLLAELARRGFTSTLEEPT